MAEAAPEPKRRERPFLFGALITLGALLATTVVLWWAQAAPVAVVVGKPGRHDGQEARLADCLDCHVPFVGTPGSRCLSPGCHGQLATGTPPRDGPALPIRYHAALRAYDCGLCHAEHSHGEPTRFSHATIPEAARERCSRCHGAQKVVSHPKGDPLECSGCHAVETWRAKMDHTRVDNQACDLCHLAPESAPHTVAGNCSDCHRPKSWDIAPPQAPGDAK